MTGADETLPAGRCLLAQAIATPIRPMLAVTSAHGVCLLEFLDRRALASEIRRLCGRLRLPIAAGAGRHLDRLRTQLDAYFAGTLERFDVPLDTGGTPFQRRVWDRLIEIPYGGTVSYSRIAADLNARRAVRAVGRANGLNPIAIVIPCHRVVRADGSLCGYGGGLWRKRWLLDHERRHGRDANGAPDAGD
jgi:AraC family transcriptional regulator of adaptative response/methylated-DNA-[protein]-cysteine methyltransferase